MPNYFFSPFYHPTLKKNGSPKKNGFLHGLAEAAKWMLLPFTFPFALTLFFLGILALVVGHIVVQMFDDVARSIPMGFSTWLVNHSNAEEVCIG